MGEDRKNLIIVAGTQFFQLLERKKRQQGQYLTWNMGAGPALDTAFILEGPQLWERPRKEVFQ